MLALSSLHVAYSVLCDGGLIGSLQSKTRNMKNVKARMTQRITKNLQFQYLPTIRAVGLKISIQAFQMQA